MHSYYNALKTNALFGILVDFTSLPNFDEIT